MMGLSASLGSDDGVKRFAQKMRNIGLDEALRVAGVESGDTVSILDFEFEFEFELLLVSLLEEVTVTELDLVLEDSAEEEPLVGFRLPVELTKLDFEPVFDGVLLLFAVMLLTPD